RSLDIDPGANFLVSISRGGDVIDPPQVSKRPAAELPRMPQGADIGKHLGGFYTEKARETHERWRLHAVRGSTTGQTLVVGKSLAEVDGTVDDLIAAELVIGAGVLVVLAGVGVAIVQASLHPLREIERTAAAIAAGDLTRRVPESPPETEVGHLAR